MHFHLLKCGGKCCRRTCSRRGTHFTRGGRSPLPGLQWTQNRGTADTGISPRPDRTKRLLPIARSLSAAQFLFGPPDPIGAPLFFPTGLRQIPAQGCPRPKRMDANPPPPSGHKALYRLPGRMTRAASPPSTLEGSQPPPFTRGVRQGFEAAPKPCIFKKRKTKTLQSQEIAAFWHPGPDSNWWPVA